MAVPHPRPPGSEEPEPIPPLAPGVRVIRGEPGIFVAIARRLVSQSNPELDEAAKRLVASAPAHNIDLTNTYATVDDAGGVLRVRQACLAVLGAGRTAMLFVSEPVRTGDWGGTEAAFAERAHVVRACCEMLARERSDRVVLAQALPDPDERYVTRVLGATGFQTVGTLRYMRRVPRAHDRKLRLGDDLSRHDFGPGVRVRSVAQLPAAERDAHCIEAMDASYEETLDCPELCGLRETRDILASHKSTGAHDPAFWWIVYANDRPCGCAFYAPCPEQRTCELVYLGLGRALRGRGLARALLSHGIGEAATRDGTWSMTCAVDERNAPAMRLYEGMQFRGFARRRALVRTLESSADVKPPVRA